MSSFDRKIKVRITQPGMQTYTGYIRGTRFVDGESVDEMPIRHALLLGAACSLEDMEGRVVSPNYVEFVDAHEVTGLTNLPPRSQTVEEQHNAPEVQAEEESVPEEEDEVVDFYDPNEEHADAKKWDLAALEAIADAEGISGLREIGDEFGVKERSIDGLIREIMKAQSGTDKLAGDD